MIKIAMCDDERAFVDKVKVLLERYFCGRYSLSCFNTAVGLLGYVFEDAKGDVDLLIMDIEVKSRNGIDLSNEIVKQFPQIKIIFLTAYPEYSEQVYMGGKPSGFILKPIKDEVFEVQLSKLFNEIEKERTNEIVLKTSDGIVKVKINLIQYISNNKRIITVHTESKGYSSYMKISDIEMVLDSRFIRCHQSYIVNMDYIENISTKNEIHLTTSEIISISRANIKRVKEVYLSHIFKGSR